MAELVTGHAGKAHATAEQAAGLNAGILGLDDYVLNVHDKFKITVQRVRARVHMDGTCQAIPRVNLLRGRPFEPVRARCRFRDRDPRGGTHCHRQAGDTRIQVR